MLHECPMSIVTSRVQYASCMSYEYTGTPRFLMLHGRHMSIVASRFHMLHGCHMSIVATQVPYASWMSYEFCGIYWHPVSLCFMDVI